MRVFSPLGQLINLLQTFTECNLGQPPAHVLLGVEFVLNGVRCFKHPDVMPRNVVIMDGIIMGHIV